MKAASRLVLLGVASGLLLLGLHGTASAVVGAPELDPGTAAGGLTLLVGGALVLLERFRRR
ncbi:MAG: hypothetical protein JO166_11185 [Deltaproteobacteria bacterium]|nr:hypothetical protein [Deltaproteobacteria bacterium]